MNYTFVRTVFIFFDCLLDVRIYDLKTEGLKKGSEAE